MSSPPLVTDDLLKILRCPKTHSPLRRADESLVTRLQQAQRDGSLMNQVGEQLERPLRGGLVNQDESLFYPVYDHGPTLVVEEAIALPFAAPAPPREQV